MTLYNRQGRAGCGSTDRDSQSGSLFYYDGSKSLPYGYDFVAVIEEFDMTADIVGKIVSANMPERCDNNCSVFRLQPGPAWQTIKTISN